MEESEVVNVLERIKEMEVLLRERIKSIFFVEREEGVPVDYDSREREMISFAHQFMDLEDKLLNDCGVDSRNKFTYLQKYALNDCYFIIQNRLLGCSHGYPERLSSPCIDVLSKMFRERRIHYTIEGVFKIAFTNSYLCLELILRHAEALRVEHIDEPYAMDSSLLKMAHGGHSAMNMIIISSYEKCPITGRPHRPEGYTFNKIKLFDDPEYNNIVMNAISESPKRPLIKILRKFYYQETGSKHLPEFCVLAAELNLPLMGPFTDVIKKSDFVVNVLITRKDITPEDLYFVGRDRLQDPASVYGLVSLLHHKFLSVKEIE